MLLWHSEITYSGCDAIIGNPSLATQTNALVKTSPARASWSHFRELCPNQRSNIGQTCMWVRAHEEHRADGALV